MQNYSKGLIGLNAASEGGPITAELTPQEITGLIEDGHVLVLERVFDEDTALAACRAVMDWAVSEPVFPPGQSASRPGINFHRRDGGGHPSRLSHVFHQFGFGDFKTLNPVVKNTLEPLAQAMLDFQNEVAGTDFRLNTSMRCKVLNHNAGGGFLVKHTHPYLPMKAALFLSLSTRGKDYQSGGVEFDTPFGTIDTTPFFNAGNILLFRYDMPHEVMPVDGEDKLNWHSEKGLWLMSLELVESHGRSEQ